MSESSRPSFSLSSIRDVFAQIRRRFPWPFKPPIVRPDPVDMDAERLRVQIGVIRRAFGDDAVAAAPPEGPRRPRDDAEAAYLFRPGHMLVREGERGEDFERFTDFFRERDGLFFGEPERLDSPTDGLVLVRVPARRDEEDDVLKTLEELDEAVGRGVVTPDHILYVTGWGHACPATEPEETSSPTPVPPVAADKSAGADVRVAVVDTGWWSEAGTSTTTEWLAGVVADQADLEVVNPSAIHAYAGHGTFVAGVVRCMAPAARVEVEGFLPKGGAVYESEICKQLDQALLDNDKPQIISVSAGTHTRLSVPLLGFELLAAARGLLDPKSKVLVVAAAGNDGNSEKFYPAAFDWVVGVGSVDPNGRVSKYSNVGDWVKVYARGRDIVNAFPIGTYTCYEPENIDPITGEPDVRHFRGLAQWSGTSFSTPIVSGAIAAQMSATGETDPRAAYEALFNAAPQSTDPRAGTIRTIGPL